MALNKSNIRFKERISTMHKLGIIIQSLFVTIPFLIIAFMNLVNIEILLFVLGWCALIFLLVIYRFYLVSNVVLSDEQLIAYNRGYHRHFSDISGAVVIRNGKIFIPYKDILEVKVKEGKIYLNYRGLTNNVVLQPVDKEKFITSLNEKLINSNHSINIINDDIDKKNLLKFRNEVLTNKPTIIIFIIILSLPNISGIYNVVTDRGFDSYLFATMTALVTITFFIAIFLYKVTMILSDEEMIVTDKMGDTDLGEKIISYKDIVKITKTKWRVDIKTKKEKICFVPSDIKAFYSELQKRVNEFKK